MAANVTQSALYVLYKDAGFSWNIAIWALLLNVVGISGQLGNAAVIWATYRTKSLRGTANYHLAMGCFFEILHQNGHLLFLYVAFTGQNFIPYRVTVYWLSVALFGMGSIALSITFTAFDRLLFILFPMITHKLKPAYYLSAVTAICLVCCGRNVYIFYAQLPAIPPELMITGSFDDLLSQQGDAKEGYNTLSLTFNCITFAIYATMGIIIKYKKMAMSGSARIFKSIFVLITVNLSGFIAMRVYRLFLANLIASPITRWYIGETMSLYLNMSTASTGLVLYLTSNEYRNAYRKEFNIILSKLGWTSRNGRNGNNINNKTATTTMAVNTVYNQQQVMPLPQRRLSRTAGAVISTYQRQQTVAPPFGRMSARNGPIVGGTAPIRPIPSIR